MTTDLIYAKEVEVLVDDHNKLWLNIDGRCIARIGLAENLRIEVAGNHEVVKTHNDATTIERHHDY